MVTKQTLKGVKRSSFLLFLSFATHFALAQDSKTMQNIDDAFAENRFEETFIAYQEILKTEPNNVHAQYYAGLSLFKSGRKAASLPYFKATYAIDPHYDKFLLKYLARGYQLNYQFDTAIVYYTEYESHLHKQEKHNQILEKDLIEKRIQECKTAKELIKKPKDVKISNMGKSINSKYDDYSPAISADEQVLMFTSRREFQDADKSKSDNTFFEEVFVSDWQDSVWSSARSLSQNVNGNKHDACVAISPDGSKLIVYKSNHITKGDLYFSDYKNGEWTTPEPFSGGVNSNFFEPSATINTAENLLIFSSDRPGGFGGLDLYICRLMPNGKWGKAENLGATVNTKYDEDAPFLQTDQRTLHFSSNGHNSIGGYDIFTSTYDHLTNSWTAPENAGHPINTPDDDIYFSWNNDGTRAYFSSIREDGLGGQDLYTLQMPVNNPSLVVLKGSITDKVTQKAIGTMLKISVFKSDSNKVVAVFNSSNETGKYVLILPHNQTYGLQAEAEGYTFHSENFTAPKTFDFIEITKDIALQPIEQGTKVVLNNIFFEYNKSNIQAASETELKTVTEFMRKNADLQVEIGGHTDSIGSVAYNQRLSEARALAVKSYLEKQGIEQQRLTYKGYNFEKPIAPNKTPEGRQMNRRTEFLILKNQPNTKLPTDSTKK